MYKLKYLLPPKRDVSYGCHIKFPVRGALATVMEETVHGGHFNGDSYL